MKRPDTTESAASARDERERYQVGELEGDPLPDELVEGTRLAMRPPGDTRHDLIDAAITRLEPRRRKLERPPARWEFAVAGLLVGLAIFAFLVGRMTEGEAVTLLLRVVAAVVGGGLVAAYLWKRDRPK